MDQQTTLLIKKEEIMDVADESDSLGFTLVAMDKDTSILIKKEEIMEMDNEPDSLFLEDTLNIGEPSLCVKQEHELNRVDDSEHIVVTSAVYVPYSTRLIQKSSESCYVPSEEIAKVEVVPSELDIGVEESKHFGTQTQLAGGGGGGEEEEEEEEEEQLYSTRLKCSLREKELLKFSCSSCLQTFPSKYRLIMHVFIHIDGEQPPTYVCKSCGDVFSSDISLNKHFKVNGSASATPFDINMCTTSPGVSGKRQAGIGIRSSVTVIHRERSIRDKVIALVEEGGCSIRKAGRKYGVPHTTALRWWRNYLVRGTTNRAPGSGRRRVSSQLEDRKLVSKSKANPFLNAKQLQCETNYPGSSNTVRRRLRDAGLYAQRCVVERARRRKEKVFSTSNDCPRVVYRPLKNHQ